MSNLKFHISKLKPSVLQSSFDFDAVSKRQARALAVEHPAERISFIILVALLAFLFCSYFFFVIGSVFNVIGEKQADAQSATLRGSIASLEQQYFSLAQGMTPQEAQAIGLSPVKNTAYIYRPGNAAEISSPIHAI